MRLNLCRKDAARYLKELGCTVYNPNVGNTYGDDGWLLMFTEQLEKAEAKQGFVLQLQQGEDQKKTQMQLAEEDISGKLPRVGVWVYQEGLTEERREPNGVGINGGGGFYASSRCSYQIPSDGGLAQTTSTLRHG